MSFRMSLFALVVAVSVASQAAAGTFFRLEVGPPVAAAGSGFKVKSAVFAVRPRLCTDEASVQITGSAEGLVNGARQSVPLTLVPLPAPGVHVVSRQWPDDGQWVVHLRGTCPATKAITSALVPVTARGFVREKVQLLPEAATRAQVDAAVRDFARSRS